MEKSSEAFRTISEVAEDIDVPQHVLRFWESRFTQIRPLKRGGGRRFYRPEDVNLLRGVRHLLYGEGYTIRGVQRILREQGVAFVQNVWRAGAELPALPPEGDLVGEADADAADNDRAEPALLLSSVDTPSRKGALPERREPKLATIPPPVRRAIPAEAKRRLRAALDDLIECRRLIEDALADREGAASTD